MITLKKLMYMILLVTTLLASGSLVADSTKKVKVVNR